jgi:cyclic pyranopterin phosphate synthase
MAGQLVQLGTRRSRTERAAASPLVEDPPDGPLVDTFGRVHRDLRVSLTDQCNLRCVYCMPDTGMRFQPTSQHLRTDEIVRVVGVARGLGIDRLRLTGGEPLLRPDAVSVVAGLRHLGFDELAMTTNGIRLAALARPLADAGLTRVNISCDSLDPDLFAAIRRRGTLAVVLGSMDAAEAAGLGPVKINVVPVAGMNDHEIERFAQFGRDTGRTVRFIEFMPLDAEGAWTRDRVVSGDVIVSRINRCWPLESVADLDDPAPATRYRYVDGAGEIGIVASVTRPFCGTCDRLRLTADGALRNCLFSDDELSARDLVRSGAGDAELALLFRRAVWGKRPGHGINDPGFLAPARTMSLIGG